MTQTATRRLFRLAVMCVLAAAFAPLEPQTAEAKRIKFRSRSHDSHDSRARGHEQKSSKQEDDAEGGGTTGRSRSSFGTFGSRSYAPAQSEEERSRATAKSAGAAAAAAERARAALAAEQKRREEPPVAQTLPAPGGKTTSYDNGVTCLAGC
jgi:hypothetical protein